MRVFSLALATLLFLCVGSIVQAKSPTMTLFDYFQAICIAHSGDAVAVKAAAKTAGFLPLGGTGASATDTYWEKSDDADSWRLMVMENVIPKNGARPPMRVFQCLVGRNREDAEAPQLAARWASVPASPNSADGWPISYEFIVGASGDHRDIGGATDEVWEKLLADDGIWRLGVMTRPQSALMLTFSTTVEDR